MPDAARPGDASEVRPAPRFADDSGRPRRPSHWFSWRSTQDMNTKLRVLGAITGLTLIVAACGGGTATTAPGASGAATNPPAASGDASPATPSQGAAEPLSGDITLWHSYGSGGGETGALNTVLDQVRSANPDLNIEVIEQPFDQIFNKWRTETAA